MIRMRSALFCIVVACALNSAGSAQSSSPSEKPSPTGDLRLVPGAPAQEFVLQMLDSTASQASAVRDPALRAQLLVQLAEAWKRANAREVVSTLEDAFRATSEIDPRNRDEKQSQLNLQRSIMRELSSVDSSRTDELVSQADPEVQREYQLRRLSLRIAKKDLSGAMELLEAIAAQGAFPYDSASALLLALPKDADEPRRRLFAQAVQAYSREEYTARVTVPPSGLVNLIVRFWHDLPAPLVLQGVDALLTKSKERDASRASGYQLTLASPAGAASFNSEYEANLFYVMPALKALDPQRAQKLLEEDADRREMATKFPGGLQTLDPTVRDTALKEGERSELTGSFSTSSAPGASTEYRAAAELDRAADAVASNAEKNPREALTRAMSLPLTSDGFSYPRLDALLKIATATKNTNQSVATEALDRLVAATSQLDLVYHASYLRKAARLYLELEAADAAAKAVAEGLKLAQQQYREDTKSDAPHLAPKVYWPSTVIWREFVLLAGQISSKTALDALEEVSDEEIRVCLRAALVSYWLGGKQNRSPAELAFWR